MYTPKRQIKTQFCIVIFFSPLWMIHLCIVSKKFSLALAILTSFYMILFLHTQYCLCHVYYWFLFLYGSKLLDSPRDCALWQILCSIVGGGYPADMVLAGGCDEFVKGLPKPRELLCVLTYQIRFLLMLKVMKASLFLSEPIGSQAIMAN